MAVGAWLFWISTGTLAQAPPAPHAQGRIYTIGYLGPPPAAGGLLQAFQQGLADYGYVEGRNLKVEYRYNVAIQGNADKLGEMAAELVSLKPDVLVVSLSEAAVAAKKATSTIPIVIANAADPVAAGLVASFARPGGNVTGLSRQVPELIGKQFQLLKEELPRATRVGVLLNPTDRLYAVNVGAVKATAESLGLQTIILGPSTTAEVESAFTTLRSERAEAVLVGDGGVFFLIRARIAELALKHRLPSISSYRDTADAGGLMGYGPSSRANYRRAAYFVDRILKGAKPADLPVEQPTRFELIINLKTAKTLGLTLPQSLLLRADELIE